MHEQTIGHPPGHNERSIAQKSEAGLSFRRYQTLHVIEFGRQKLISSYEWYSFVDQVAESHAFNVTRLLLLLGIVVVLCLCGIFGTAVVVLIGVATQIVCQFLKVQRPPGFLDNNENHSACMLLGSHQNSATWYLYIGDRGVIDSLLNKPMFSIPSYGKFFEYWFRFAHVIQLLAMTYVAAEKGWDGIAFLVLVILSDAIHWRYSKTQLARRWLKTEDVCVKAKSFEFTGRTAMLAAIHKVSSTKVNTWMDEIMPPAPRRQALLNRLSKSFDRTSVPEPAFGDAGRERASERGWEKLMGVSFCDSRERTWEYSVTWDGWPNVGRIMLTFDFIRDVSQDILKKFILNVFPPPPPEFMYSHSIKL